MVAETPEWELVQQVFDFLETGKRSTSGEGLSPGWTELCLLMVSVIASL